MTLAETQTLFHEVLTSAEPVAPERIDACFAGTPDLPAVERVAIYADMYLVRLVDALRETFPKLLCYLGDEQFAVLAEDYVRRNPPEHHDVGRLGRRVGERRGAREVLTRYRLAAAALQGCDDLGDVDGEQGLVAAAQRWGRGRRHPGGAPHLARPAPSAGHGRASGSDRAIPP